MIPKRHESRDVWGKIRVAGRTVRDLTAAVLAPAVGRSEWRRRRLLIIGYHGVSLDDEHLWDGTLYVSARMFQERLKMLEQAKCSVLALGPALKQLQEGTLPDRAVVLTFDDGFHDFAEVAVPILRKFGYPATNFVNSYYARFQRPIFDIMLRYLLWKATGKTLTLPSAAHKTWKLDEEGQREAAREIKAHAFRSEMSGQQKDELLAETAQALKIDYEQLCGKRLLHSMDANEIRLVYEAGHDIQLHTHRHRVSRKRDLFEREIDDNRQWIAGVIGDAPRVHFSYPGGVWEPVKKEWLRDLGIESASTSLLGLADAQSDPLMLPRFIDHTNVPSSVFRSWLAGSMDFVPKGTAAPVEGQILEENIRVQAKPGQSTTREPEEEQVL